MSATDTLALVGTKYAVLKDPDAVLDYSWDWSAYLLPLTGDSIATAAVTAVAGGSSPGITVNSVDPTFPAGVVTAWVQGGTIGQTDTLTCHITTTLGREDDRTISIIVKAR